MSESLRAAAIRHCPFCAEEDLWPTADPGGWHCRACARVFTVGLLRIEAGGIPGRVREESELAASTAAEAGA